MWKLALARDAIMLTIGAHAVAFAPDASKTSSKNWRWALAWRSRSGDSGRETGRGIETGKRGIETGKRGIKTGKRGIKTGKPGIESGKRIWP